MNKTPATARGVGKAYEYYLEAKLRDRVPAWLRAMRNTPPADSLVRSPTLFSTRGQYAFEKGGRDGKQGVAARETLIRRTLPKGCVSARHNKAALRTRCNRPPRIVFPEDELRREFYKNHPFEMYRPRIVMELTGRGNQNWSQLTNGPEQVTGENVVRYQHYLMEVKGMSKQEAYAQATQELYRIRAREEVEAKVAQQEARFHGAQALDRPFSAKQLAVEEREILKSTKAFAARGEEQLVRSAVTEKMFAAADAA
ncbi:mitochondrial ribosomal small subunit component [Coemansia biformis]|uniref:Small ribosomal subunit protein mS23 n=1 Tax=Coemansia biformis TaxID=1286918 RepID=A0A9W7YFK4_9FUNG|nr:mitochondrial ribosomal small subunit component [Coemansia biformis]